MINDIAYVGLGGSKGHNSVSHENLHDFWSFDHNDNSWERLTDFPTTGRTGTVSFILDNNGLVGMGQYLDGGFNNEVLYDDFFIFNPIHNTWEQGPVNEFGSGELGISFTYQSGGYINFVQRGNYLSKNFEIYK